ncbi:phosphoenolpyruvate synthase [Labilibaculum filiforme]|uniref:Phosphoenolpyruvate synthase n=1 Tax=Labilibaculum filiforme TaxID=1940526 RepID=A0A2N3HZN2_9BACT|nr:PEP/pyruvate-binding domain-containing protein [Labilibaculum filiforme]PKQ63463.1 phosphoenolpyruvate synthase [Labilibaculum filiforme]
MKLRVLVFVLGICFWGIVAQAQPVSNLEISKMIESFKKDPKGPYQQIMWFCPDGSMVAPKMRCPEPGGVQRAKYKDAVVRLAQTNHVFLGQILATTPNEDFWDASNQQSRLKQYLLEKYLQATDNAWVLRRGQFYRGAIQAEDENAWGIKFCNWLLANEDALKSQFYLVREAVRGLPHMQETKSLQNIRSLSLLIADSDVEFMDARIKIHGQPDQSDIERVKAYKTKKYTKLEADTKEQVDKLIRELEVYYQPIHLKDLERYLVKVPVSSKLKQSMLNFTKLQANTKGEQRVKAVSDMLFEIRENLLQELPANRLAFLDVSIQLESILFYELTSWKPQSLKGVINLNEMLAKAATACGYIELWEWQQVKNDLQAPDVSDISLETIRKVHDCARSIIEWGTGMNTAVFDETISTFGAFEPLTYHFTDDRIRSSVLLPLGASVSRLGDFMNLISMQSNEVMDIENQSHFRGLNPGFAKGELVVVEGNVDKIEVSKEKIYLFSKPPSDLKPVAGIATVSEGNMVSHVQLLARNLGIPNAVLSQQNLTDLKKYSGTSVFYVVSPKGKVIIKPESRMTDEEKKLFVVKKRSEEKIRIPVEQIDLNQTQLVNLRKVNAANSGKLCGPKAANLGQLKQLFPDQVVEGLVVPFGIFRKHMDQAMPEVNLSYWQFLNQTFRVATEKQKAGLPGIEVDEYVLGQLATLSEAIKKMPLLPEFKEDIKQQFISVLGKPMGKVPVFLRSDTNMEDLKSFTGAGLNLTLFNVLDTEKIVQGIKDVWASPYSERSYKWRQSYLLNPENVFPSILIIPSVDVDYSGVLITKGVQSGNTDELTIAFSRGAGGAVDGQVAQSHVLEASGVNKLLSPAREPSYNGLPSTGGTLKLSSTFEKSILSMENLQEIRVFANKLQEKLKTTEGVHSNGPWDVELGFKNNKLWLFQVRPFVENKQAKASAYLQSVSPEVKSVQSISLTTILK